MIKLIMPLEEQVGMKVSSTIYSAVVARGERLLLCGQQQRLHPLPPRPQAHGKYTPISSTYSYRAIRNRFSKGI